MKLKPQHYLNGKNWIQMRQGCLSGESGVSWPVTPQVSCVALLALVPWSPPDLIRHGIELTLLPSGSIPGMESPCPEKENTYSRTFIPDLCMAYM